MLALMWLPLLQPGSAAAQESYQMAQYRDPSLPVPQEPERRRRTRSRTPFALPTAPVSAPRRTTPATPSSQASSGEEESALPGGPTVPVYNTELLRLSEILGSMHYLRPLCGADEAQTWRRQMENLIEAEGADGVWKTQLVHSFNKGFRAFERSYRECTPSATVAVKRYMEEGNQIAQTIKTRYAD